MQRNEIGDIMEISAYKFENSLRLLGLQLKHGYLPLEQMARRLSEISKLPDCSESELDKQLPEVFFPKKNHPEITYDKIRISPNFILSSRKLAYSWFLVKNQSANFEIIKLKFVKKEDGVYTLFGMQIENKKEFFVNSLNSTKLYIFESDGKLREELLSYDISSIFAKMLHLPYENKFVFMPLMHTLK